jgi:hypothetical protein
VKTKGDFDKNNPLAKKLKIRGKKWREVKGEYKKKRRR